MGVAKFLVADTNVRLCYAHLTGAAELHRRLGPEGFVAYVRGRKQSTP